MDVGGKGDAIVDGERDVALTCSYIVDGKIYMPMSYSGDNEHVISSSRDGCVFLSNLNETSNPYKWIV